MHRWLKVMIAGVVVSVALGAGAAMAVLAATSDGSSSSPSASLGEVLTEAREGHSWLGILATNAGDEGGVLAQQVFVDSPAHEAGLRRGDVITALGDAEVGNLPRLKAALAERQPGDQVTLIVLRSDEEITMEVTLGERPEPLRPREPKGPFPELGEIEFADILSAQVTVSDDEGNPVTINVTAGEVMSISEERLTVALNEGGERTFEITGDTVVARERLEEGTPVVVLTVGDSDEARIVIGGEVFRILPFLSMLRERLHEFLPMEIPELDVPRPHMDIPRFFDIPEGGRFPLPEQRFAPLPEGEPFPPLEEGFQFELEMIPEEATIH